MKMLTRKIHGGFNQVGSEASSDEEEEGSEVDQIALLSVVVELTTTKVFIQ